MEQKVEERKHKVLLNNNNVIILTDQELNGFDIYNDIDLSRRGLYYINNKTDLLNYIQLKRDEMESIRIAEPLLKKIGIEIDELILDRFSNYDASALLTDKKHNVKDILLDFKYIKDKDSDTYNNIVVDEKKLFALVDLAEDHGIISYLVYVYGDGCIRVFSIADYKKYIKKEERKIPREVYKKNSKENSKISTLYYFNHNLTQLVKPN